MPRYPSAFEITAITLIAFLLIGFIVGLLIGKGSSTTLSKEEDEMEEALKKIAEKKQPVIH